MRQIHDETIVNPNDARFGLRASRRALLRGGLGAVGAGALAVSGGRAFPGQNGASRAFQATPAGSAPPAGSQPPVGADVAIFPVPGTRSASPATEISFRGIDADALGAVKVVGARSGGHSGILIPHSDGNGVSYLPDAPFQPGESVTVQRGDTADGSVSFTVARPAAPVQTESSRETDNPAAAPQAFHSRPDLLPPVITVTISASGTDSGYETASGYIFVGAKTPDGQNGPMILDDDGELVWFAPHAVDTFEPNDFRVQEYRGEPVLTSWEGASQRGTGLGHFVIRDSAYQEIAELRVANGYPGADLHEFLLTPQGTALIVVYNPVRWDLSSVGGETDGVALDGIVQELDVATGRVVFEWHSLDHIALDESFGDPTSERNRNRFDYLHLNGIEVDEDGNLIITGRHTHATYKIDYRSGEILWRLNGKRSDFTMGEGTETAYHHDARVHPNGELSIFDNAAGSEEEAGDDTRSRGVVLQLDMDTMTATLVREYIHPTKILSVSQGNVQMLPNGNAFVGWGNAPVFSEFGPAGELLFNARFPKDIQSYRAYRFPWTGQPSEPPAAVAETESADEVTIYVSWNGATEVAVWQALAGPDPDRLQPVGTAASRTGFETAITVESSEPYFAVQALDDVGQVLGVSAAIALEG